MEAHTYKDQHLDDERKKPTLGEACSNTSQRISQCVKDDPGKAMLISVGAGLGLGVVVGAMLAGGGRQTSSGWLNRRSAERLGRQLMSSVSDLIPDAISDRI